MSEYIDTYVPYEATAEVIAASDDSPELFLRSLFPDATYEQIQTLRLYTAGKILDGIHYGLALSTEDPISPLRAHLMGVEDGYEQAIIDLERKRGEQ